MKTKQLSLHKPLYEANTLKSELADIEISLSNIKLKCRKFYEKNKSAKNSTDDLKKVQSDLKDILEFLGD